MNTKSVANKEAKISEFVEQNTDLEKHFSQKWKEVSDGKKARKMHTLGF